MNFKELLSIFLTFVFLSACSDGSYGKKITASSTVDVNQAIEEFEQKGKADFTIKGKILQVCQTEGCWFNLETKSRPLLVDFNHDFKIPMNSKGASVIAEGHFTRDTTSVEQLKEYAKDDGKSAEEISKINQPEVQLVFHADGVKIEK